MNPLRRAPGERRPWLIAAALVLLVSLVALPTLRARATPSTPAAPTATVVRGTLTQSVAASGTIGSNTSVDLDFAQARPLKSVEVRVGQQVRAGDVLATQVAPDLDA